MDKGIDVQVAELLASQTYAERMEMAQTFRDYINGWREDNRDKDVDADIVAFWFECYVDLFPDADDDTPSEGG